MKRLYSNSQTADQSDISSQRSLFQTSMNTKKVLSLRWLAYVLPMFFMLFSFEALSQGSVSIVTSDASTVETTGSNVGFDLNVNIGNSLPADADGPLIIEFVASASSSATEGDDFIVSTTTVDFTPGDGTDSRTQTAFDVVGDDLVEGLEVVSIELTILSSPTNYTYTNAGSVYSLTLNDNDASTISISSTASASEGDDVVFTISMTNPSDLDTEVTFQTSETGTATEDVDYVGEATGITVTFPAGDNTSQTVNVSTIDEAFNINESDETFSGIISGLNSNGRSFIDIGNDAGIGTILNDDPVPTVTINPGSATEGDAITMSVQLSNAFGGDLELAFAASDGTATVGSDVSGTIANLLFTEAEMASGTLNKNITVNTIEDTTDEPSEDFTVSVSSIVQGTATPSGTGLGTINDDDTPPNVSVDAGATTAEGDPLVFTVRLSNASSTPILIDVATVSGTAISGTDFNGTPSPTLLTFAAEGSLTQTVTVTTTEDNIDEVANVPEDLTLDISENGSNTADLGTITDNTGTISDDDDAPTVTITAGTTGEDEGASQSFSAVLSHPSDQAIALSYTTTADGTAAASDFTATSGTWNFPALSTTPTEGAIAVPHTADNIDEGDDDLANSETYSFDAAVSSGTVGTINGATGNIIDDDVPPAIAFSGETDSEGNPVDFTFSITNAPQVSDEAMVINVITSVETGDDAEASDYTTLNSTVTFPALSSGNQTASVATTDDTIDEVGTSELETFTLTASVNSGSFSLDNTTSTGTIQDADAAPALTIGNPNVTESESTETASFSLNLTAGASGATTSSDDIILDFTTTAGTATADTDYTSTPNSITATIPAGSGSTTAVTVDVLGDTDYENGGVAETFMLNAAVNGASVGQADVSDTGDASIIENDPAPYVSISDATVVEGSNTDTNQLSFTVSLDRASVDEAIEVFVSTSDGSAIAATTVVGSNDYEALTNFSVTFAAGETSKTVLVDVNADNVHEGTVGTTENMFLDVSSINSGSASFNAASSGEGTIEHDDVPPLVILAVSDNGVDEDTETSTIRAILTGNTTVLIVSVDVAVSQSIATPGDDFNIDFGNSSFTLTVNAGDTQSNFATLTPVSDNIYEDEFTEEVTFEITSVTNGTESGTQEETLEILDSDVAPVVNISSETEDEGTDLVFTVELGAVGNDLVSANDIVIDVTTTGGTAEEDVDYTGKTETVTIPAGSDNVTFTVTGTDDTIYEQLTAGVEDFTVSGTLNGTSPGGIDAGGVNDGTGTIVDTNDAPLVDITVSPATIAEAAGVSTVTIDFVGTTTESEEDVTVPFSFAGNAESSDYMENSTGSVVITAGNNTNGFTVTAVQDNIFEVDEEIEVIIGAVTGGTNGGGFEIITITDDDPAPEISLSLSASSVDEGNSVTLTASIDNGVTNENGMTVDLDYNDETTNGTYNFLVGDFSANPSSIFIPAGSNTVDVTLTANNDIVDEENEDIEIEIDGITNGGVGGATTDVTLTINDDDAAPNLSDFYFEDDAIITEDGADQERLFAEIDAASEQEITVSIAVDDSGNSAQTADPADYSFNTSTITIEIGSTSASSTFTAEYDDVYEPAGGETLSVSITGVTNVTDPGTLDPDVLTVEEDGSAPTVFLVNSAAVTEGAALEYGVFFSDNGSGDQVDEDVTIDFGLGAGTSTTFVLGADYNTDLDVPETITISAFSKGASLTVSTDDDALWEDAETLSVDISASSSANEASYGTDTGATGVVNDNDTAPTIALATDATINEDDPNYEVAATLSAPAGKEITIGWTIGGTAVDGSDYDIVNPTVPPTTIPVNPSGATSNTATFEIDPINENTLDENDETVTINLTSSVTVTDADQTVTITDAADNLPPTVTVTVSPTALSDTEGTVYTVTGTLSAPPASGKQVTVNFTYNGGSEAEAGDYDLDGSITITAGNVTGTTTIEFIDDDLWEGGIGTTETLIFDVDVPVSVGTLDPDGGALVSSQLNLEIEDNELTPAVRLNIDKFVIAEDGTPANGESVITFTLVDPTDGTTPFTNEVQDVDITLDLSGEAVDTEDYAISGDNWTQAGTIVTIPMGETNTSITVTSIADILYEGGNESAFISVDATAGADIYNGSQNGNITITEGDDDPVITIEDVSASEGDGSISFVITSTPPSDEDLNIAIDFTDGTAVSSGSGPGEPDFDNTTINVVLLAGDATTNTSVPVTNDNVFETDESFTVYMNDITGTSYDAVIDESDDATLTISNDDARPLVVLNSGSVASGSAILNMSGAGNEVNVNNNLDITNGFTLEQWVYITTNVTTSLVNQTNGNLAAPLDLYYNGNLNVWFGNGAATHNTLVPGLPLNAWTHIAVTYDPTSPTSEGRVYLNGSLVSTIDVTAPMANVGPLRIGRRADGLEGSDTYFDEVRVWNTPRSAGEIASNYENSLTGDETGLVVNLQFNNNLIDAAGGDQNGTLVAGTVSYFLSEDGESSVIAELRDPTDGLTPIVSTESVTVDLGYGAGTTAEHTSLGDTYDDFDVSSLTVTIPSGSTSSSMTVSSYDDNYDEGDGEDVVIEITTVTNGTDASTAQTIIINDDDDAPDVEINSVSADEDETMTFDVFLTGGTVSDEDMIVDVSTMDTGTGSGYAIAGTDYTALSSQSVTISARSVSNTVDVTLTDDNIDEVDEEFDMFIANATSTIGVGSTSDTGTGTISDDNVNDPQPTVNMDVATVSVLEDDGTNNGSIVINMSFSNPSSEPINIDMITADGTALEGTDFIYVPNTITVPALSTSLTTSVSIVLDDIDEFNETFAIGFIGTSGGIDGFGATGGAVPTEVTITDNDDAPELTFDDVSVSELEANGSISFDFTLSNPSSGDITIDFTATGTNTMEDPAELNDATFADDFNEIIASVTVSAGSLTGTAVVDIFDDATDEFDEEFTIDVAGSSVDANGPNSLGATDTSVGIILDDDDEPAVLMSVLDDQLDEAVPESTDVVFNLIGATEKDVTVDLVFNDGIAAGSGIADLNVDYTVTGSQVIIPAGDTQSTLTISSIDEAPSLDEVNETIFVEVDAVDNGIESGGVQDETVIIIDGDLPPVAKLTADANVTEGTGSSNAANITVTLHDPDTDAPTVSSKDVTVYLETLVNDAIDGSDPLTDDYSISNLTLTIEAFSGSTTTTALNTIGDAYDEMDEDAEFRLYDGINNGTDVASSDVTVDNTEVITTIQDDDNPPVVDLAVDITNTDEQNAETLTYTVSVDQRSNLDFTLDVTTSGSATVADDENLPGDPEDYSDPVGSVSFSAAEMAVMEGNIFKTFTVTVNDDGHYEIPTETAVVDISVAATSTGLATINTGTVSTNINNDEALPVVSIQQFVGSIDEDEFTPTENINIFSMDRPSQLTTTANFDISGDAILDSDYTITGTTLVVQPGQTTSDGSIDITVIDDAIDENIEVVTLTVGTVTNADAGVVGQVFNVNIIDNEAGPEVDITIDPDEIFEEDGVATITATLSEPSGLDVTITLGGNISGTADEDDDYTIAASGAADNEIVIPAGATTGTIQVLSINDTVEEGDELALIDIVNVDNGSIGTSAQVGVTLIEDNDPPAGFSVNFIDPVITTVNETNISLEILGGEEDATFDYTITDGTNIVTGSGTIVDSDRQEVNNIDLSIMNEGVVTVTLTLTDDYGNISDPNNPGPLTKPTDTIDKQSEGQAFPQGFSPNNDGVNDFWVLPGIELHPDNLVVIFNRYGKIVWQDTEYDNANTVFDGVSNSTSVNSSASLPDGTYFYVVTYSNPKVVQKGFIIIRR